MIEWLIVALLVVLTLIAVMMLRRNMKEAGQSNCTCASWASHPHLFGGHWYYPARPPSPCPVHSRPVQPPRE